MLTHFDKALAGFVVSFVAALVAQVQSGTTLALKTWLLALGTAVVTSYSVYQTRNKVTVPPVVPPVAPVVGGK